MTDDIKLLSFIEVADPALAKDQQGPAEAELRAKTAAREQAETEQQRHVEIEREDNLAAQYLRELTAATRELRANSEREVLMLRETSDVASLAQELRKAEDTLSLLTSAYEDLMERQKGLHKLEALDALVALTRTKAFEADAMAIVSHIRTVVTLEAAYEAEGRIGFVGHRTQEMLASAKEAHRIADVTENDAREARAAFSKQQQVRISSGILTSSNVRHAIGH
jgi:hypothetical protein